MSSFRERANSTIHTSHPSRMKIKSTQHLYHSKQQTRKMNFQQECSPTANTKKQLDKYKEIIREQEIKIMQHKNIVLRKDIEISKLAGVLEGVRKEIDMMRIEKQALVKNKAKTDREKRHYQDYIEQLEGKIERLQSQQSRKEQPKDRYETCMRELDMLKNNLDNQEDRIKRERDFYREICLQVKSLATNDRISSQNLKNNLRYIFNELGQNF